MIIISPGIGSKCAVILPQNFVNPQITPAKGLVVNKLINSKSLVLIEEIWQFLEAGFREEVDVKKAVFVEERRIRKLKWGWKPVPELVGDPNAHLLVELFPTSLNPVTDKVLDEMISKSIEDFLSINRI